MQRRKVDVLIRRLVEERGWTLDEIKARSGLDRNTISLFLRGVSRPRKKTLAALATALQMTIAALERRAASEPATEELPVTIAEKPTAYFSSPAPERVHLLASLHGQLDAILEGGQQAEEVIRWNIEAIFERVTGIRSPTREDKRESPAPSRIRR